MSFEGLDALGGSAASGGSVGFTRGVLDDVRAWLGRFVCVLNDADLDLLTLWAAHTYLCVETYTTPRLVIDSPVPGSGKTTLLEHLSRLCLAPVQVASLSSPAMLARLLDSGLRTILIDEVDRNLDPNREGTGDLLAVLNAGYKRGATRPTLVPTKDGWAVKELPTFAPVAMAGNAPNLPDDTRSRTIRVLLLPDLDGTVESSDWEEIETEAKQLGDDLAGWADTVRADVLGSRPTLPKGCTGRHKERWAPLLRVAVAAGGRWPSSTRALITRDLTAAELDKEDGMATNPPAVMVLLDVHAVWPEGEAFVATEVLLARLIAKHPKVWGAASPFGKPLTAQRLGRMLAGGFAVHSGRRGEGPRGYYRHALAPAWRRMGVTPLGVTDGTAETGVTDGLCRVCSEPLDPALDDTTHPMCDPAGTAA